MKNKFLLLATALVLSTTATFAANQSTLSNYNSGTVAGTKYGVTPDEVRAYIMSFDIVASYVGEEPGTTNYLVKDTDGIWYRVYVCEAVITGWGEMDY